MSKIIPCSIAALLAFVAFFPVPPAPGAEPKRDALPEAPPPPVPLALKVKRGETAEIPLRIYGRKNEPLKYLIRVAPERGKVSAVRVVEREASAVTYTPPADLAVTRDKFSYAVQSTAGVSAPAEVTITIVDAPARLAIPDALDFPPMLAGATAAKAVEITNRGGSIAEGELAADAPWKIAGSPKYRLGAGESAYFKLVFAPPDGGVFDGALRYTSQPEQSTRIHGEAKAVISAEPSRLVLQTVAGDAVRAGSFELSNATDTPRKMRLTGGERLQLPAEATVPANGKVSVPVRTAAGDAAAFEAEIRAEAPGLSVRVAVQAPRLGAVVRVSLAKIDFGRVDAAKPAAADFEIENAGGSLASIACEIGAPFSVAPATAVVMPGEKKNFAVRTDGAPAGKYRGWLKVKSDPQSFEIPVDAVIFAKAGLAKVAAQSAKPAAGNAESTADETVPAAPVFTGQTELVTGLRPVKDVNVVKVGPTAATVSWPVKMSGAEHYRIESRNFSVDENGDLKVRWQEVVAKVQKDGGNWSATVGGLLPGAAYDLRAVPVNATGGADEPLFQVHFMTREKAGILQEFTPLRALLAVFACWLCFLAWRRLRSWRKSGGPA